MNIYPNSHKRPLLLLGILFALLMYGCHKPEVDKFYPDRLFQPTTISVSSGDTAVIISWNAIVNKSDQPVSYTVEINDDSSFSKTPDLSLTVDSLAVRVTNENLLDRHPYFARVRANANDRSKPSGWLTDTVRFSFVGIQIFHPLNAADILDKSVKFSWTTTPGVSSIRLSKIGKDTLNIPVTDLENQAGEKIITGLDPASVYNAEIFAGTKSKGILTFSTKFAITGAHIIDLTMSASNTVLMDTLPVIPSGSTIILSRGRSYDMSGFTIDKSLTFISDLGFGQPATLALSNNFDVSATVDTIQFKDLTLSAAGASYLLNIGNSCDVGYMLLDGCQTTGTYNNSLIRLKTGASTVRQLTINNCIIKDIGLSAKYAVLYANANSSAVIDKITVQNSTFSDFYYFVRQDGVSAQSLSIANCTFNNFINQAGYFVNYSATFPAQFTLTNCLFGATLDPTSANGIKSSGNPVFTNCYQTSDCIFSANPFSGLKQYSGASTDLFMNTSGGDYTFKDQGFAGKSSVGDPRWRN